MEDKYDERQLIAAAIELVADMRAAHDKEVIEAAIGWTVLCWDVEYNHCTVHGFWEKEDLIEVMRWANAWERELNRDFDEPQDQEGWRCVVHPIGPKDER